MPNILSGNIRCAADAGRLLAERRKAQGLTQAELAALSCTGVRLVGDLERGKGTAQIDKALHLLGMVGVELVAVERGS